MRMPVCIFAYVRMYIRVCTLTHTVCVHISHDIHSYRVCTLTHMHGLSAMRLYLSLSMCTLERVLL